MKRIIDTPLKILFPLILGIATMVILTISSVVVIRIIKNNAIDETSEKVRLIASDVGAKLAGAVNKSGDIVRTYSDFIKHTASSTIIPNEKKREQLLMEMQRLVQEKRVSSVWCIFEPNALDGLDSLFISHTGSNSKGVFSAFVVNDNNKINVVTSEDGHSTPYYTQPKTAMHEVITEPFWDDFYAQPTYIFSFCIPLIVDGQFIGVVGTDIKVDEINEMVKGFDLNMVAAGRLISDEKIVVTDFDVKNIGQVAENGNQEILNQLANNQPFSGFYNVNGKDIFKVFSPVEMGQEHWYYAVDVPRSVIYEQANKLRLLMIFFNAFGVIAIFLVVFFMSRGLIKWIEGLTGQIETLSLGRLDLKFDNDLGNNEIGKMSAAVEKMTNGLHRTSDFARQIGQGKLDTVFEPLSDDDTLGNSLIEMRNNLQKAHDEEEKYKLAEERRNWGTTGLAKFAEILRQDNDNLEELSYNVISNLVKYLGANQGGIFIINDEDESNIFLELKASYAYNRKKFLQKQIAPGEGLVGTCYLEGEPVYMTDLPNDYIKIVSGLGNENPRALFILPLKINGEIYGVIEVASFIPFEPYQIEFINRLGESIAATISSVKVNLRTNRLLVQTKLQAEEMTNQEEELRQNMEEMQATQEEMRRREAELSDMLEQMKGLQLESKNKELELEQLFRSLSSSFHVIQFSGDGILTDVNDNVLNAHHLPKEAFVGKPLSNFVQESETEMKELLDNLNHGIIQTKMQEVTANGKTTLFRHDFIPFIDANGKAYKIVLLAYPA